MGIPNPPLIGQASARPVSAIPSTSVPTVTDRRGAEKSQERMGEKVIIVRLSPAF
jgi:hypothetical protein